MVDRDWNKFERLKSMRTFHFDFNEGVLIFEDGGGDDPEEEEDEEDDEEEAGEDEEEPQEEGESVRGAKDEGVVRGAKRRSAVDIAPSQLVAFSARRFAPLR